MDDKIECVCDKEKSRFKCIPEKCGEYYVQNIKEYLEYLYKSDREKDKMKIGIVEEYINNENMHSNKR